MRLNIYLFYTILLHVVICCYMIRQSVNIVIFDSRFQVKRVNLYSNKTKTGIKLCNMIEQPYPGQEIYIFETNN